MTKTHSLRYHKEDSAETRAEGGASMTITRHLLKKVLVELDDLKRDLLITLAAMLALLLVLSLPSLLS
jgi:hypothetical protein